MRISKSDLIKLIRESLKELPTKQVLQSGLLVRHKDSNVEYTLEKLEGTDDQYKLHGDDYVSGVMNYSELAKNYVLNVKKED